MSTSMEADHQLDQIAVTPRTSSQKSGRRLTTKCSPKASGQQSSSTIFSGKRSKAKSGKQCRGDVIKDARKVETHEHKTDIWDEKSDFLGYNVYSGKLVLDEKDSSKQNDDKEIGEAENVDGADARLTCKALILGSFVLSLEDVVSVSFNAGVRYFTVHAYPSVKKSGRVFFRGKPGRVQKDFRFIASSVDEAIMWVTCFADQQFHINLLPHPVASGIKQASDASLSVNLFDVPPIKCKTPPKILVILNPRSGHGRSSKVFHSKVEPIFKLAGFQMEIVKTTHAGHAKSLASTVDFGTCPDGIVCVGGDGIINEVLNGLLCRGDQKEAISIPIGIIPAGSDNSLVWTVLGVREPVSAALAIVKGGLTPTDVLVVEWIHTGLIHFGTTVSYFGFVSDVLELSEKFQARFGPLRYFVAGFLKFLCLPSYFFELEYLPVSSDQANSQHSQEQHRVDLSELYTDIMRRSKKEGIARASSLSSIDSIMSPRMSVGDIETSGSTVASNEPSDYVRGIDPKTKRLSSGRNNIVSEPEEVLHPSPHSSYPNWIRPRSKTRTDKTSVGFTTSNDSRSASLHDKEDISSTVSDPGPIWDSEPKWDAEPNWEPDQNIELATPATQDLTGEANKELKPNLDENWVIRKGHFLGILVCNHSCRTVQSSQIVAPDARHDDNSMDLLLVSGKGKLKLLRFLVHLQLGRHLSLPYVEYVKVKSVKVKPGANTHNGCGIDGELQRVKGQVVCSLFREQCRLIGRPAAKDNRQ